VEVEEVDLSTVGQQPAPRQVAIGSELDAVVGEVLVEEPLVRISVGRRRKSRHTDPAIGRLAPRASHVG
jgi:hypothetical protein